MPILKLKAIDVKSTCGISKQLIDELQELIKCPREYFSLEVVQCDYILDGEIVSGLPVVEVYWFDRGQEVQDKAAETITKYIHSAGYTNVDVIFFALKESRYYENGVHF